MTIEQEAEKYAINVELPDFDLYAAPAIVEKLIEQAYIAGSTARMNEAKDFAEWVFSHYIESYCTNGAILEVPELFERYKQAEGLTT